MHAVKSLMVIFVLFLTLLGCTDSGGGGSKDAPLVMSPSAFSETDYDALTDQQKYVVSNNLAATLFNGVAAADFFNTNQGLNLHALRSNQSYIETIRLKLSSSLDQADIFLSEIEEKYEFDKHDKPIQLPLAILYELPMCKEYYDHWMAYVLTNTILFSPAVELETTDSNDTGIVYNRLVELIGEDYTIEYIVYAHMISQENWRRFRSPEDNTREMMEIYLNHFNDADVPVASKACQNWSLSDAPSGYRLLIDPQASNDDQLDLLGSTVVTCNDFYQAVSKHPDLIPTIAKRLVDIFLAGASDENKADLVAIALETDPITFRQLFTNIIFSRTYLMTVDRPKRVEEVLFNTAHRIDWKAPLNFFNRLNRRYASVSLPSMGLMKQAAFMYKLGQPTTVPLDTLSFSYFHKLIRKRVCIDGEENPLNDNDGGWRPEFISVDYTGDEFIDYLFLSVTGRVAEQSELDDLNQVIVARGYDKDNKKHQQAMIVMDYLSRLSEVYYLEPLE